MKGIELFRFLAAVWAVPTFGAAFFFLVSCDSVLSPVLSGDDSGSDLDTDTDTDSDTDADTDTDTDSDTDDTDTVPQECWIQDSFFTDVVLYGVCQVPGTECSGGYFADYPQANCSGGLHCCIGDDQCLEWDLAEEVGTYCSDSGCESGWGFTVGCPGDEVCCLPPWKGMN